MCDTGDRAEAMPAEALPADLEWKGEVLPLEPVDELSVLMVCDNTVDILLPDEGPAKRLPLAAMARLAPLLEAPTILGGKVADVPLAQHGFSALVEVRKGGRVRRLLFDTGITPAGCAGNLRRLGKDPADIEAIVCSHGHFDHTTGLSGLIGDTISALEQLAPEVIVPAHCTGWKATHAIARRLPGAFLQNSVGTTFRLSAAAAA
jgi:glyoxylase-like metal-dependent hydrolase (beta-lactamase superfamily II)